MEPFNVAIMLSPIRHRAVTAAFCFGLALVAGATVAAERSHYFAPMARNDELAQGTVNALLQDSSGLMWIGTQGGLHRYDGRELLAYQHQADVEGTLPESFVTALAETTDGTLYIGTNRSGVVRLDRDRGRFVRVTTANDANTTRDRVTALAADARRGLWIGSQFGIELLATGGSRTTVLALSGEDFRMVRDLAVCENGDVLAATARGAYRIGVDGPTAVRVSANAGDDIVAVHCGRDGSQWLATPRALFHLSDNDVQPRWSAPAGEPGTMTDIAEDMRGTLWLSRHGHGAGLVRFDPKSNAAIMLEHDPRITGSLPEDSIRTLFVDRSGLLWVGGDLRGVSCTEPSGAVFNYLFNSSSTGDELPGNDVRALLADGENGLWIGTEGDGLKHYDFSERTFTAYRAAAVAASATGGAQQAQHVTALADAGNGQLWVGTPRGLARFDPKTGQSVQLAVDATRDDALPSADIRALARGADGSLWIGTLTAGLVRYEPDRQRWEHFVTGLWSSAVMAVHEDRGGRVWIGTLDGLNVYERATGRLHKIAARNGDDDGLAGDMVRSILETRDGGIWIGTHSGLNQLLSYENGVARFRAYRISDGLANDTIYGLLDDGDGRIWASNNRGVFMLDPRSGEIINFTTRDGLQGPEFNGGAQARIGNDRLAFGGTRGINWLQPSTTEISRYEAPLAFTSVQIGSQRRRIDDPAHFREVRLAAADRVLMLSFAALDFATPERNRYRYRLLGYDEQWVDLGTRREVAFTNLGPGSYELEVLGSNRDGRFGTLPLSARCLLYTSPSPRD